MARVRAVPVGFAARAPRVREGEGDRGFEKGVNELSGTVQKTRVIYYVILLGAKKTRG
jgi:hypothetical protein